MLLGGQGGLGDQAGYRRVEGHLSGCPSEQRHQVAGQQHTAGHRPRAPRRSWWPPVGNKRALVGESGCGPDMLLVGPKASGEGGLGAVAILSVSLPCITNMRLDKRFSTCGS